MLKTIIASVLLATVVFSDSIKREPIHIGLVKGCSYGIMANLNPLTIREECNQCISAAPINKSDELAEALVDDCVNYISKTIKKEKSI